MGFLEEIFKKRTVEKLLEKSGSNVKKIKKLLPGKDFHFFLDYVENLDSEVHYLKSPYEILTPIGIFEIPVIIETKNGYVAFLPSIKKMDPRAVREYLVLIGFLKKTHYFNSQIIIINVDYLPPVLQFYTKRSKFTGLLLALYVDSTIARKDKDPLLIMVENFQDAFHVTLDFTSESLKMLDEYLSPGSRSVFHEVLTSKPLLGAVNIFHSYLEKIFQKELTAGIVESGKLKTGTTHLLQDFFVLSVDFKGKFLSDLRDKGKFSFYSLFEDAKQVLNNPGIIPRRENMPFLEWKIRTDQLKNIVRPIAFKNILKDIAKGRVEQLKKYGPLWSNGWCDLYFCPVCHKMNFKFSKKARMLFQDLDEIKSYMLNRITYIRGQESDMMCSECSYDLNTENLIYSQFQHFLPDLNADLQLNFDRLPKGHYFYMWQSLDLHQVLSRYGTDFSNGDFQANFGRHISAAELYDKLMDKCVKTRKAETMELEDGYHIFAVPPLEEDNLFIRNALSELTEPLKKSKRNYFTYNLNFPKDGRKIRLQNCFIKWAPAYQNHLTGLGYQLIAIVDMDKIAKEFEKRLIDRGIIFHLDKQTCYMDDGKYRLSFDFYGSVWEMIQEARYLTEFAALNTGIYITKFQRIANLYRWMNERFLEKMKFDIDRMTGVVSIVNKETGKKGLINIYEFIDRLEIHESQLEEIITSIALKGEHHSRICECGSPANLFIRLISKEKLEEIKVVLGNEEPISMSQGDKCYVFKLGCPNHNSYLTRSYAKQLGMDDQAVLNRVLENIHYDSFDVDLVIADYKGKEFIGVIGEDVATLATDARRIKALLALCYQYQFNGKVAVYSDSMETLVISDCDTSGRVAAEFSSILKEKVAGKFEKTYPVNQFHQITLPPEGEGKINVLSLEVGLGENNRIF